MRTLVRLIAVLILPVGGCGHKQAASGNDASTSDSIPADLAKKPA